MKKIAIVLLLALSLVACQEPPQAAIDSAKQALTASESAEAAKYAQSELSAAQEALRAAESATMKAAGNGVVHKNLASRKVSRLSKRIATLSGSKKA